MEENSEGRTVQPCGKLYSQGKEYFLLSPRPIVKDSWQDNGTYCFVVVPSKENVLFNYVPIYPCARHIVTNAFVYEIIPNMPKINIAMDEYDVTKHLPIPEYLDIPWEGDLDPLDIPA